MNKIFSSSPIFFQEGLAIIRIATAFFLIYHGVEIFDETKMNAYLSWDQFKASSIATIMVYTGKAMELAGGILLFIGFFTRIAAILIICTMAYISFFVGNGKIWYEDQHPFLFVLLALVFFFNGGGVWSVDNLIYKTKK